MQAVDVTGLTANQIARVESNPEMHVREGPNGIGMPVNFGPQNVTQVRGNQKNRSLLAKFGDKVFNTEGKLVLKRLPRAEILKRLQRRKDSSRENLLAQLGEEYVIKLYNSNAINESDMKLETKRDLNKACCKFAGISPKKTAEEKRKSREAKKRSKAGKTSKKASKNVKEVKEVKEKEE